MTGSCKVLSSNKPYSDKAGENSIFPIFHPLPKVLRGKWGGVSNFVMTLASHGQIKLSTGSDFLGGHSAAELVLL